MVKDLTVIKLGGSLLTDKSKPFTIRESVIKSVTQEIGACKREGLLDSLIIIHGVGSFGHPLVLQHKLYKGFMNPEQLDPLSKTQQIVNKYRLTLVDHLQAAQVPVILMHPSSLIVSEKMKMKDYFLEPLKGYLALGISPILGGDLIYDRAMGFSVGSGDQLAALLTGELSAKRLIFVSDVSGIFEGDPKTNPEAPLIEEINLNALDEAMERMGSSSQLDASGTMKGKLTSISALKPLIEQGLEVTLISMLKEGNLRALLSGGNVDCTRIVAQ